MTLYHKISEALTKLPETMAHELQQQLDEYLDTKKQLSIAFVGAFSVGKSSLINALLGEKWLSIAQQEATALPTYIQYGKETSIVLVDEQDQSQFIDRNTFNQMTIDAPEHAKFACLSLPQTWLQGVSIIDLPGLGSVSEQNDAYTMAQIQYSDIVVYLLAARGPTKSDLDALKLLQKYGKHVLVVVNRWDEVEKAVALGEKAPDLMKWEQQIQQEVGVQYTLLSSHIHGLNHDKILAFIAQCKENEADIRLKGFLAQLQSHLKNQIHFIQQQKESNQVLSDDQAQVFHQSLIQQKQDVLQVKSELYQKHDDQQQQLWKDIQQLHDEILHKLDQKLNELPVNIEQWDEFLAQGSQETHLYVADIIALIQEKVKRFSITDLPTQQIKTLNLSLPTLEQIDGDDLLQAAQLNQLKQLVDQKTQEHDALSAQLEQTQHFKEGLYPLEQNIASLAQRRQALYNAPIPQIEEMIADTTGADTGRRVGEFIDTMLSVIPITAVASKIGKLAKVAKSVKKVQETVQKIDAVKSKAGIVKSQTPDLLSMISVATWGEKIGGLFDQGPKRITRPDESYLQQRQQQDAEICKNIQLLNDEVMQKKELISQHHLVGFSLEQKTKEIKRLEKRIQDEQQQLIEEQQQAQDALAQQQKQQILNYQKRAIKQWLNMFTEQFNGVKKYLKHYLKGYWDVQVNEALADRLAEIDVLQQQINKQPNEKQQKLQQLQKEEQALQITLQKLVNIGQ